MCHTPEQIWFGLFIVANGKICSYKNMSMMQTVYIDILQKLMRNDLWHIGINDSDAK